MSCCEVAAGSAEARVSPASGHDRLMTDLQCRRPVWACVHAGGHSRHGGRSAQGLQMPAKKSFFAHKKESDLVLCELWQATVQGTKLWYKFAIERYFRSSKPRVTPTAHLQLEIRDKTDDMKTAQAITSGMLQEMCPSCNAPERTSVPTVQYGYGSYMSNAKE